MTHFASGDEPLPDDYEPPEHERAYYRNEMSGALAYVVRVDGMDRLKTDSGADSELLDLRKAENGEMVLDLRGWKPCDEPRPILVAHAAMIAFEADKTLCRIMGKYHLANREFGMLTDRARISFINDGPQTTDRFRREMWEAVMGVVRRFATR